MPDIGLFQQIYLSGVIVAFSSFIIVLAGGYIYSNSAPRKPLEGEPAGEAESAWSLQRQA